MSFTEEMLGLLRESLKNELSEKRFEHSLGVEIAALSIAKYFPDIPKDQLSAAALLHDVAKELPNEEQTRLALTYCVECTNDVFLAPQVLHAFAAPGRILEKYSDFATEEILSAVKKHTTGDEMMSIFDMIIFVADYIEPGRTYPGCIAVREALFAALSQAKSRGECEMALNLACINEIDETIKSLRRLGQEIDGRTLKVRNVIASLI